MKQNTGITAKPSTSINPTSNAVLEWIHQVLGNLVRNYNITQTYVGKDDPCSGILSAVAFEIFSTTNRLKSYSTGQFKFERDVIVMIKHTVGL